jgi:hypothetical protein
MGSDYERYELGTVLKFSVDCAIGLLSSFCLIFLHALCFVIPALASPEARE